MHEEKWREDAAAFEEWFKTALNPNSAAYYYLAAAYYRQEDFARALAPAKKAVEPMDTAKPNESWLSRLSALQQDREEYREAIPVLRRLIDAAPYKKSHWIQLSAVYVQTENYANGLAVMQLAYNAELQTEDSELRRLADLLVFNDVPYRGGQILEAASKSVTLDEKLYEKLANCWIELRIVERRRTKFSRAWAGRAVTPGSFTSCTTSPSPRRGTSIRPRSTRASACRNSGGSIRGTEARSIQREPEVDE
jgi:tetratricopeptide (TPR) repeat protein